MLNLDITRRPVRIPEWMAVLDAVHGALPSDEQQWLEWKSTLDLTSKEVIATVVSKAIIAFANRDPAEAARTVGGVGILLVGLEPGTVHGVTPMDNADLDQKISSYVSADGPVWAPHWCTYQGKSVLIIEVYPPQWGDPIHCFRKDFGNIRNGQIFVRKHARSEPAGHSDVTRLADRYARSRVSDQLDIEIRAEYPQPLSRYTMADLSRDSYIDGERKQLMRPLNDERVRKARIGQRHTGDVSEIFGAFSEMTRTLSALDSMTTMPEKRTEDQYAEEVNAYLERVTAAWPEAIRRYAAGRVPSPVFAVVNNSSRNLHQLEVQLHVSGDADAQRFDHDQRVENLTDLLPDPPRLWGPYKRPQFVLPGGGFLPSNLMASVYQPPVPRTQIDCGGSFKLTFPAIDLRPHETQVLDDEICVLIPATRNEPVVATWTATAVNVDAKADGQLTLLFDGPDLDVVSMQRAKG